MNSFMIVALVALLCFAAEVVTVPTPAPLDDYCIGDSCIDTTEDVGNPFYAALLPKNG
jgi:hypothetical protein